MSSRDLVSNEGVDEGSAASTAEGLEPRPGEDVLGEPPHGAPRDDAQDAEPVDMETGESREARAAQGPGQQYQVGEG